MDIRGALRGELSGGAGVSRAAGDCGDRSMLRVELHRAQRLDQPATGLYPVHQGQFHIAETVTLLSSRAFYSSLFVFNISMHLAKESCHSGILIPSFLILSQSSDE